MAGQLPRILIAVFTLITGASLVVAGVSPGSISVVGNAGELKIAGVTYTNTENIAVQIIVTVVGVSDIVLPLISTHEVPALGQHTFYFLVTVPVTKRTGVIVFSDNEKIRNMVLIDISPLVEKADTRFLQVSYPDTVRVGENATFIVKDLNTGAAVSYGTLTVREPVRFSKTIVGGYCVIPVTEKGYWTGSITAENGYASFNWVFIAYEVKAPEPPDNQPQEVKRTTNVLVPSPLYRNKFAYICAVDDEGNIVPGVTIYVAGMTVNNPGSFITPDLPQIPVVVKRGEETEFTTTLYTMVETPPRQTPETRIVYETDRRILFALVALAVVVAIMIIYIVKPDILLAILRRKEEYPR